MELEPGNNSYVTIEEADGYIARFHKGDTADYWSGLSEQRKTTALLVACAELNSLPFAGRATYKDQPLSFPRHPSKDVPQAICYAQIEIALLPFAQCPAEVKSNQRLELQRQGVTSFSLGDLSESYGGVSGMVMEYPFLLNERISRLISRYLHGGHTTC